MDINIHNAFSGYEEEANSIIVSESGLWYADMSKDDAFYQLRARIVSTKPDLALHYYISNAGDNAKYLAKDPLEGRWWHGAEMRTLSDYRGQRGVTRHGMLVDFHQRVERRLDNGYSHKKLCLHPDYMRGVVETLETLHGKLAIGHIEGYHDRRRQNARKSHRLSRR